MHPKQDLEGIALNGNIKNENEKYKMKKNLKSVTSAFHCKQLEREQ